MARRWLEDGRRDQGGYIFLKETYIFGFFIVSFLKILYFCNSICPMRPWCHLWMTEPMGGALHIRRRYWRFVFGYLNVGTSNYQSKTNAEVSSRGMYIRLRSVRETLVASTHTLRVYYILLRGTYSVVLLVKASYSLNSRTTAVKHPRFLYVVF